MDEYMMGWAAWAIGSVLCLMVWAKWLKALPETLGTILWWVALGLVCVPAPESIGSEYWSPALITTFFDFLNHAEGGGMRAGKPLLVGAVAGLILGVVSLIMKTRRRLANVG